MSNKNIVAIGGGGFGRSLGELKIEKYITSLVKKERPKICFIPTASGDNDSYKLNFYRAFSKLNCITSHLDFFSRTENLEKKILSQDIIYVGGGNTKSMLAVWRDWGLDIILEDAYQRGVIMSGVSAGAICWFENGLTDSWESELKLIECMNLIPGNCAPHYDEEPERRPATKKLLKEKYINFMYGIEGGAALHFVNETPKQTIRFEKNKNAYKVTLDKDVINENAFEIIELRN